NRLLVILFLLPFLSCSSNAPNDNELPLFNNLVLQLNTDETVQSITPASQEIYERHFSPGDVQIPLYRHISHTEYDLFVGIPYRTSLKDLKETYFAIQDSTWNHLDKQIDSSSYYRIYQDSSYYRAEYAAESEDGSLIYLAAVGDTTDFAASTFSTFDLTSRIRTRE
ncbi:MAG: hypothetical protein AAFY48_24050, partial [Bacteroidota bacterium]